MRAFPSHSRACTGKFFFTTSLILAYSSRVRNSCKGERRWMRGSIHQGLHAYWRAERAVRGHGGENRNYLQGAVKRTKPSLCYCSLSQVHYGSEIAAGVWNTSVSRVYRGCIEGVSRVSTVSLSVADSAPAARRGE